MFPCNLVQSANTEFLSMKTNSVSNRSRKNANVLFVKIRCFYSFIINSPSKLKKFSTLFSDIYQEKLATKYNKVSWWALFFGDPRNSHSSFFVKGCYLNSISFQALQSALSLKTKKNLLKKKKKKIKKNASHKKTVCHSKRQKKNIEKKRKKKEK